MNQGTYQIMLRIQQPIQLRVGGLGVHRFPAGRYIYVGRASRGLTQRMQRHLRREKPRHWHIDYLTSHPRVTVGEVQVVSSDPNQECSQIKRLLFNENYQVPVIGFGSSDCRAGCPAHLLRKGTL